MAVDRTFPTEEPTSGPTDLAGFAQAVHEETTALWNRVPVWLSNVGGTANAITAGHDPAVVGLVDLQKFDITPAEDSLAGGVTLDVDGLGPRPWVWIDGEAIGAGRIRGGRTYTVIYVAANDHFKTMTAGGDGEPGPKGEDALTAALRFGTDASTDNTNPTAGKVRTSLGLSITKGQTGEIRISSEDRLGGDLEDLLQELDSSDSFPRGAMALFHEADETVRIWFAIIGDVELVAGSGDDPSWLRIPFLCLQGGTLSDATNVGLYAKNTGDRGVPGGLAQMVWSTNTSGDPGGGKVGVNTALYSGLNEFRISETDKNAASIVGFVSRLDASTSAVKGTLRVQSKSVDDSWLEMELSGSLSDNGSWRAMAAAYVAEGGTPFATDAEVWLIWSRTGDAGTGAVASFNGRAGAVTPAPSDYDASQIDNDSSVAGSFVSDALNTLNTEITSLKTGRSHQDAVLDRDLTVPPGSPATGDRYIVAATATGDWATHDNEIAEWDGSAWVFTVPEEGFTLYVTDEDRELVFGTTTWSFAGSVVDHDNLQNTGINSHAQIDTKLGNAAYKNETNVYTKAQRGAVVALTDGANIAINLEDGNDFSVTIAGNRQLDNATGRPATGNSQTLEIRFQQEAVTGGHVPTFDTDYCGPDGGAVEAISDTTAGTAAVYSGKAYATGKVVLTLLSEGVPA